MGIKQSSRARGANRGGIGGGYEATNPDYNSDKLRRLKAEYNAMDIRWRDTFLAGLSRFEQKFVTGQIQLDE